MNKQLIKNLTIQYGGLRKKPTLRKCMTMHDCQLCKEIIACGQEYYDRGLGRRLHKKCLDSLFKTKPDNPTTAKGGN